jgi:hypothetical protein
MKMFTPVFIRDVFWNVTWVNAKPVPKISTGSAKARNFSHLFFMAIAMIRIRTI